ncbi:exosome complex component RRP45 isoform X2 [Prorops nasuta]
MKKTVLSNCEFNFLNKAIESKIRLDGRDLLEGRSVKINFGSNWGNCIVSLGQTRVVTQITCDIQPPKSSRPNEGLVHLNVELNGLAAQHFDNNRQTSTAIMINRLLEKCIKDSKCIDLESLCIVADKKVWNLRVDINIISHDGNLIDCASVAALAALLHFHRPDVTSTGENIIIHSFSEKDPLPLTLFHYPLCVSFITFENGTTVMDPTYLEERVGVAQLTLGLNSYRELCCLHFDYLTKTMKIEDVVSAVSNKAANHAYELITYIKNIVAKDVNARYNKTQREATLKECIPKNKITVMLNERICIKQAQSKGIEKMQLIDDEISNKCDEAFINKPDKFSAELLTNVTRIGEGGTNTWQTSDTSDSSDNESDKTRNDNNEPQMV